MIEQCETVSAVTLSSPREILRGIGGAMALYLLYALAVTGFNYLKLPLPPLVWAAVGVISTVGYLLIIVYAIRMMARLVLPPRHDVMICVVALLLFLGLNPMIWQAVQLLLHGTSIWEVFAAVTAPKDQPVIDLIVPVLLIVSGTFFGRIIARLIRERALLVPVAIISGMIDFWGVYWGPVNAMSESAPAAVSGIGSAATVAASVPDAAIAHLSAPLAVLAKVAPPDSIGIGDFVFLSLFLTCAYRLGFSAKRIMWGIFAGLLLASTIMAFDGLTLFGHDITIEYLPGLLFICGGMLLANLRAWKMSRQEWAMTGVLVALLAGLISMSVVRAELSKPRNVTTQYTLTPKSLHTLPEAALARIVKSKQGLHAEVLPLTAQFLFSNDAKGVHLVKWGMLALSRQEPVTLRGTWEHAVLGMPQKSSPIWMIVQQSASPPDGALRLMPSSGSEKPLARIRHAKGIPPHAFALLDRMVEYRTVVQGQKLFLLEMQPQGASIITGRGKVVKRIKY